MMFVEPDVSSRSLSTRSSLPVPAIARDLRGEDAIAVSSDGHQPAHADLKRTQEHRGGEADVGAAEVVEIDIHRVQPGLFAMYTGMPATGCRTLTVF